MEAAKKSQLGTVCIAWGSTQAIETTTLYLPGARSYFQQYVAAISLDLIRRLLLESDEIPRYLIERKTKKIASVNISVTNRKTLLLLSFSKVYILRELSVLC